MGDGDDIIQIGDLVIGKIGNVFLTLPDLKASSKASLSTKASRAKFNNTTPSFIFGKRPCQSSAPFLCLGNVKTYVIATGENIGKRVNVDNMTRKPPGVIDGDEGVVTVNLHIHVPPGVRHQDADRPQSDNAQFLPWISQPAKRDFSFSTSVAKSSR